MDKEVYGFYWDGEGNWYKPLQIKEKKKMPEKQTYCEVCGDTKEKMIWLEYKSPVCITCAKELTTVLLGWIDDD